MTERKLTFHRHSLDEELYTVPCNQCENIDEDDENPFEEHKELIESSLNHPSHCQHPSLDFYQSTQFGIQQRIACFFCKVDPDFYVIYRYCSCCKIAVCASCLQDPLPLTINFPKSHKHELTLLVRNVSFNCNACGMEGKRNPYVCLQCSFMVHIKCISLPRVININRHDHRVSRAFYLPHGKWDCGVCRQEIDCAYGAFTCARCPSYAVHSDCATRDDVWDGEELEDEPEEEEMEEPFKVINETDIIHFSHEEHILRHSEEDDANSLRCDGCVLPINYDPFYKCVECNFCLHKTCANLPRKKRHFLHNHKLTLKVDNTGNQGCFFRCSVCGKATSGFSYVCEELDDSCKDISFDIRCSSIGEPFHHELHQHPLYRISTNPAKCHGCNKASDFLLSCIVCDYVLCMECATLPRKVKQIRCDDHFLTLCQGVGNANGDLWCDVCETKTDPSVWYYTCDLCGTTLHVNCVLGYLYYMSEGRYKVYDFEILPNNGASRPFCIFCRGHCRFPSILKTNDEKGSVEYFCSVD